MGKSIAMLVHQRVLKKKLKQNTLGRHWAPHGAIWRCCQIPNTSAFVGAGAAVGDPNRSKTSRSGPWGPRLGNSTLQLGKFAKKSDSTSIFLMVSDWYLSYWYSLISPMKQVGAFICSAPSGADFKWLRIELWVPRYPKIMRPLGQSMKNGMVNE